MARTLPLCGFLGTYALELAAPDLDNLVGGDMDDFGCISSAGYTWCESQSKCLRSWENDCTSEDEDDSSETLGADEDQFGCIGSAGYTWCEKLKNCMRAWDLDGDWVEECEIENDDLVDNSPAVEDDNMKSESSFDGFVSINSSNSSSNSSSQDDGYWYYYDRKARVREWFVQFFSVAGPLFVCVTAWALYLKRKRRKRQALRKRSAVVQMLNGKSIACDSRNYVVKETIAVRNEKRKATGQNYEPFSTRV